MSYFGAATSSVSHNSLTIGWFARFFFVDFWTPPTRTPVPGRGPASSGSRSPDHLRKVDIRNQHPGVRLLRRLHPWRRAAEVTVTFRGSRIIGSSHWIKGHRIEGRRVVSLLLDFVPMCRVPAKQSTVFKNHFLITSLTTVAWWYRISVRRNFRCSLFNISYINCVVSQKEKQKQWKKMNKKKKS